MNTLFLPGTGIADGTIVGACSVVTKSFTEENIVIGGNPSKRICIVRGYVNKNFEKTFDFRGENQQQKREIILSNKEKWLIK